MRDAFVARLTEHARRDSSVNLVVGDLGWSVVTDFADELPAQFLNAGVAEQAMIGVAAGLAASGRKVFVYSIANFPTMRCLEQIRNDVCYHALDVTIVSVGAGLAYGPLGYSHHAVEDIAVMRALPGLRVYSPADAMEVRAVVDDICEVGGPAYLRLGKNREPVIHGSQPDVSSGAPLLVRTGDDVTIMAVGAVVSHALALADALWADHEVSARVLTAPVVKPLSGPAVLAAAAGTRGLVTMEEHSVAGGFGSAVLEALASDGSARRVLVLGLRDEKQFAVGSQPYLRDRAGLALSEVIPRVMAFVRAG